MRLVSGDGGYFELRPVAYQLEVPELALGADDDDDDGEWLIVRGAVRLGDGREWAFAGPYLTASETRRLREWLVGVAAGRIASSPATPPGRDLLSFTEPDIAFSVAGVSTGRVSIRAHFSHVSMPPWQPHHDWPDCPTATST